MVTILQRESKIFTKVPGGYFSIVCGIIFLAMLVIAIILHSLTIPVSLFTHFVSSMGIGPNGSAVALEVGLLALAFGLYPLVFHLCQLLWMDSSERKARLNNHLITFAFVMAMVCVPGLVMAALFTMAPATLTFHAIGAMLIFIGTIVFGGFFWISFEMHKQSSWALRVCSACVYVFFACMYGAIVNFVMQSPVEFQLFLANPGQTVVDLIGNTTDPELGLVRFFEWPFIVSMVLWSMNMGVRSIRIANVRGTGMSELDGQRVSREKE